MNARSPSPLQEATSPLVVHAMTVESLEAVMALETEVYPFPWSHGNFVDSIAAGHLVWMLESDGRLIGYCVAMPGFEEMHLLNITIAPAQQRRGHGRRLLADLVTCCAERHARQLWLEVRVSNVGAQQAYRRLGFTPVGMRRNYYPAARGAREDAIVMCLPIGGGPASGVPLAVD